MSVGNSKIGKMFMELRSAIYSGAGSLVSKKNYEMPFTRKYIDNGVTAEQLPKAPINPWRKRPVKLIYDKNDFQMFRLPSEKAFLFNGMDYNDLFGKRRGT